MPASARKINLLPLSDFESSFWGRFLRWAVSTGRYIIILTELVVIVAFLSRFKLDNDISNLNSAIEGKKNVLVASSSVESQFRSVQNKINAASQLLRTAVYPGQKLDEITKNVPAEIKITSVSITPNRVSLTANTLSDVALGQMLAGFRQSSQWKNVNVTQIVADQTKGIIITIEMTI